MARPKTYNQRKLVNNLLRCGRCKIYKPLCEFKKRASRNRHGNPQNFWTSECLFCAAEKGRRWGASERGKRTSKNKGLMQRHGITLVEYETILAKQNGTCAICQDSSANYALHLDHNHTTGKIRGILCRQHNLGLGSFQDDPNTLRKAANYLDSEQYDWGSSYNG